MGGGQERRKKKMSKKRNVKKKRKKNEMLKHELSKIKNNAWPRPIVKNDEMSRGPKAGPTGLVEEVKRPRRVRGR